MTITSFDHIQSDEFVSYEPTAQDWEEYNLWLEEVEEAERIEQANREFAEAVYA
jgi:hypothetical protein